MSAMVCQAPKKMKTPYFMVHIIIKNTCKQSPSQLTLLHCLDPMCDQMSSLLLALTSAGIYRDID